jgi:hypothetical protein
MAATLELAAGGTDVWPLLFHPARTPQTVISLLEISADARLLPMFN